MSGLMRIYWYWPHPHRTASRLALSMILPGDTLTVEALASLRGEQFSDIAEYEVVRDLPDPTIPASSAPGRFLRPARLAVRRSRARSRLLRRGFDVAHIEMLTYETDWLDMARLGRRTPLVSSVHDVRPHRSRFPRSVERQLLRRLYSNAGHLVVFHRALRDELVSDFDVGAERVHVVPHPLDATDRRDARLRGRERPMLLFFGTLRPNKGVDVLLDAVEAAGTELDCDVVIAGGGDHSIAELVRERAARLPNVRFEPGHISVERKRELFSAATCVVLPYTSFHSQSGVLADAYAYRLPLVVTDVGALGPTVRDDETGLVVRPGDASALGGALIQMANEGGSRAAQLDAAARRHDHAAVGPQLRSIYELARSGWSGGSERRR